MEQTIEIPEVMAKELAIVADKGLARTLADSFADLFRNAEKWAKQAAQIVVTDAGDKASMRMARELRLELRRIRCDADNRRKELKAGIVLQGRAIDGMGNVIKALCEPAEAHLQAQEDYAERIEAERKAKLHAERSAEIAAIGVDPSPYPLGDMEEAAYVNLRASFEAARDARIAAEKKAREDAERKAKEEAEERERIKAENERLRREMEEAERKARAEREAMAEAQRKKDEAARKEREAAEAKARKEREAIEAKAKAEREAMLAEQRKRDEAARKEREAAQAKARAESEARAKAEAELAARKQAEEDAKRRAAEDARKSSLAPDRDKLLALAKFISEIKMPECTDEAAKSVVVKCRGALDAVSKATKAAAEKL